MSKESAQTDARVILTRHAERALEIDEDTILDALKEAETYYPHARVYSLLFFIKWNMPELIPFALKAIDLYEPKYQVDGAIERERDHMRAVFASSPVEDAA